MRRRLAGVILFACLSDVGQAGITDFPPLLDITKRLRCAGGLEQAKQALQSLREVPLAGFGLPAEWLQDVSRTAELHLATLDILLFELYRTVERFPPLRPLVEEIVLNWNYCRIREDGTFWDVAIRQGQECLSVPAEPMPAGKQGLRAWGFLQPDVPERLVPELLTEIGNDRHGYQLFLHRIYREHCFPHPDTGALPDEETESPLAGPLRKTGNAEMGKAGRYPYSWPIPCEPPPAPSRPKPAAPPIVAEKPPTPPPLPLVAEVKPSPPPKPVAKLPPPPPAPSATPQPQPAPTIPDIPVLPVLPPNAAADYVATPLAPSDSLGFSGNAFHNWPIQGDPTIGTLLSWRYQTAWFVRVGASFKYLAEQQAFGYSWGFGYDDWHPGTISVQINNWGPVLPSTPFATAVNGAVANIGYKIKADFLQGNHMGASVSLDVPFNSPPAANLIWQWEFYPTWFVRIGLRHGFGENDQLTWTYGFGRFDWHPFTWSLTYNNWGPNTAFEPNFTRNGSVMLAWSWAF